MDRRRRQRLPPNRPYSRRLTVALVVVCGAVAVARAYGALPADWVPRSGSTFTTPGLREMQGDDFSNPGMLWVSEGQTLWTEVAGAAGKSCQSCHGDLSAMKDLQFPRRGADGKLINLEVQIERCRTEHMKAPALGYESDGLLALTTAI